MTTSLASMAVWSVAALATAGVVVRPFRWPEAVFAVGGALVLLMTRLIPPGAALSAVAKGGDVYLFLVGMMLLSEVARAEGLFDHVAARAVNLAKGSASRLFALVYGVGVAVTVFLSNDATAVVLTPAVWAAAGKARIRPLPLLFVCAFVANAASFVLPISNPANLVLYADHLPALGPWLARFALPSLLAIVATFVMLRWVEREGLRAPLARSVEVTPLSRGGWTALAGIGLTALALLAASALGQPLGLPTALLGMATAAAVLALTRKAPWPLLKGVSWSVLPLVAGLFVLVEALERTGVIARLAALLVQAQHASSPLAALGSGLLVAVAGNLTNNLPAGLVAASTLVQAHAAPGMIDATLIGVDLGPNLSVTGSLATVLWLTAIRREGEHIGFWRFLKVGALVMPPALLLALAARLFL